MSKTKEFDLETEKILADRPIERRVIEREIINANIAARDAARVEKQFLEDNGWRKRPESEVIEEIVEEEVEVVIEVPEPEPEPVPIETIIEKKQEIAEQMREVADQLNGETAAIAYVCQKGWNDEFEALFPKKAIWQGQITQSFAEWLKETKNFE